MAIGAFTAQSSVSSGSAGHILDHNEISQAIREILDELLLYRQGRRNVIRNGDMGVGQRTSPWTTTGVYTSDGWIMNFTGGTMTVSRAVTTPGAGLGMNGAQVYKRAVVASQAAAGDFATLVQKIESVRTLAGKEVTLSFVASAASGTPKIGVEVEQNFGTGGAPSATVQTAVSAITISTTATRYTVTFTIPSISGKTLGTAGNDFLALNLWLSAGSTFAARASSIGIQNATIDITDVQLEQGSGSPFERLPQAEQLAWCQRYFWRFESTATINGASGPGTGLVSGGTTTIVPVLFPVQFRATPTLSVTAVGNGYVYDGTVTPAISAWAITGVANNKVCHLLVTSAAGLTVGRAGVAHAGSVAAVLDFSAEL